MNIWIVGMFRDRNPGYNPTWEFVGAYDSEEKAEAACLDSQFFMGPAKLNETTPADKTAWPGAKYPRATT